MVFGLFALSILATVALLGWLFVLLHPARPWDFQPVGDAGPTPELPPGVEFPPVTIIVPARNEAASLPKTLPALLNQDYPGPYHVLLVDDRSEDGTADAARSLAESLQKTSRLTVLNGSPLPEGWTGKVWALHQGIQAAPTVAGPDFVLLTDADIAHAPSSLRRLVAESLSGGLGLNSRMARLHCASAAEKLLIPAFVFFFNLLYPMRRVNNTAHPAAAAAGGCMLLSWTAVYRLGGGLEAIRGEVIDDIALARQVKALDLPIRLTLARAEVRSLREYPRLAEIWKMVRRTAFTELEHSWIRLALALGGLGLMFALPVLAVVGGVAGALAGETLETTVLGLWALAKGGLGLAVMRAVYGPAISFFDLPRRYAYALPVAGVLYGLMTLDSALRHACGAPALWRDNQPAKPERDATTQV